MSQAKLTPIYYNWEFHKSTFQEQSHSFEETEVTGLMSFILKVFSQALRISLVQFFLGLWSALIHLKY